MVKSHTGIFMRGDANSKWWVRFFKGTTMGLGMIPGVSSGTMGLIFNYYDLLIESIANIGKEFKKSFKTLLPMILGAALAVLGVALFVEYVYPLAPLAITCLFAGFILGTIPIIQSQVKRAELNWKHWLILVVSFLFVVAIGVFSVISEVYWNMDMTAGFLNGDFWIYWVTLAAGLISAITCILPGVSGAMIMFIFGMYTPIVGLFIGSESIFVNPDRIGVAAGVLVVMLIGMAVGFIATSKALKYLLEKHHQGTMMCILGFILGSIVAMFCNQEMIEYLPQVERFVWIYELIPLWEWIAGPLVFLACAAFFLFVSFKTVKKQASLTEEVDSREPTE